MRNRQTFSIAVALACLAGCAGSKLDLGTNDGGSTPPPPRQDAAIAEDVGKGGDVPSEDECASGDQAPVVGVFTGYVENYQSAAGSDAVRFAIRHAGARGICGSVTFGTSTLTPPPVDDPNVGYPPSAFDGGNALLPPLDVEHFDGFAMTMLRAVLTDSRLQFQATTLEFWKTWCAEQTSYRVDDLPGYTCVPVIEGTQYAGMCKLRFPDGTEQPVDCGKLTLCDSNEMPCACMVSGCAFDTSGIVGDQPPRTAPSFSSFDVRFAGDDVSGSVAIGGVLHNVHLTRAE